MSKVRIDCMYEVCPIPLLKAMQRLKEMRTGEVLVIETDHSCAITNISDWAKKNGHECWIEDLDSGEWDIYLRKK